MKRPRITIAHIILIVAISAVAFAAIRSGSASWAGAMTSITFFVMICSLLGVALERGMRRVYWSGFATLGWGYLILLYAPWVDQRIGPHLLAPNLFTYLADVLQPTPTGGTGGGFQSVPVGIVGATETSGGFGGAMTPNVPEYQRIGEALEALLWAFAGGWVACYFASRRERDNDPQAAQPAPQAEGQGRGRTED
ncbi:hypothetical protein SAMN05444166_5294 [Singulisphaera sp. GP187]|uniref:hypothetical protein n=1 Tax=Singulisphaera sp. GP187 TaxID=1882752 RepID=UPI00092B7F8E|nr:hypothetical protein [Singulisphaera sp. GP187]SIO56785.1 hypothetical protein SAMN05444166_5294 [Singulisphaera sp. GP187]